MARFDPAQECAYFGHEGKGFIQTHVLTARNQINRVITAINNSVPDTLYPNRMDTRAKIYIYYRSGKVDSLCMNATMFYSFNGKGMEFKSTTIHRLVDSLYRATETK